LDVTKCLDLETLWCGHQLNSSFNNLDVSKNIKMQYLHCGGNLMLKKLDVKNNTNLTSLMCYSNGLKELDVSKCTKLQYLDCMNNNLKELDVSKCIKLQDLFCTENKLMKLDLTGLNDLYSFMGDKQEIALDLIKIQDNEYYYNINLNNPTFGNNAISYSNGVLKSANSNVSLTSFTVQTGNPDFILEGAIEFNYLLSSISNYEFSNTLIAFIQNDLLYVKGLKTGECINVYTVSGGFVYHVIATKEEETIYLPVSKGVYIVKSGDRVVKVIN
jgi:hypothetical protein